MIKTATENGMDYSTLQSLINVTVLLVFSVIFPPGTVLITDGTTIYHLYTTPPCITVELWFTQADADLLNFTPENKYFDGVNPMI